MKGVEDVFLGKLESHREERVLYPITKTFPLMADELL